MSATNGKAQPPPFSRQQFVSNAYTAREQWLRRVTGASDPRRNIDHECGYPDSPVDAQSYQDLYDREPLAARVVQVFPKETWQTQPQVYELEDSEEATPFEAAWDGLSRQLKGGNSYHQDEEGSLVWEYIRRADILSGIGYFGVILLGIDDGLDLSQPVKGVKEQNSYPAELNKPSVTPSLNEVRPYRLTSNADPAPVAARKLLFVRVFPESLVQISRFEANWTSPRFGQPTSYSIIINDPNSFHVGAGAPMATREVHWTRIVHLADNLGSSEVFGVPRMQPVLNPLLDIRKVRGGSAEMFWLGAFGGLQLSTHPQLGGDVDVDETKLKEMMENRNNGLQRDLFLTGMTATPLAPQVSDPTSQINVQVEAICIQLGIPVRVFKGSERGELASSQDDQAWNDRLRERQKSYVTPRLICPFVDRLITLGVLPEPTGYSVWWPDLTSQTAQEKATVAATVTGAIASYVGGNVEGLIAPMDFLTRVLGYDDEEAAAILENASAGAGEQVDAIEGDDTPAEEASPGTVAPEPEEESALAGNVAPEEEISDAIARQVQALIIAAEDELDRGLDDEERDSIVEEFLAGLDEPGDAA